MMILFATLKGWPILTQILSTFDTAQLLISWEKNSYRNPTPLEPPVKAEMILHVR